MKALLGKRSDVCHVQGSNGVFKVNALSSVNRQLALNL